MTIKEYATVSNNNSVYRFVCETVGTRYGFAHKVTMFRHNYEILTHKVNYLNRTWECWAYQTAIRGAIYTALEAEQNRVKEHYKEVNNISRITAKRKAELEELYNNNQAIQAYNELLELTK